jgi:hypothetical protein
MLMLMLKCEIVSMGFRGFKVSTGYFEQISKLFPTHTTPHHRATRAVSIVASYLYRYTEL